LTLSGRRHRGSNKKRIENERKKKRCLHNIPLSRI
jgi:hypothetical protein